MSIKSWSSLSKAYPLSPFGLLVERSQVSSERLSSPLSPMTQPFAFARAHVDILCLSVSLSLSHARKVWEDVPDRLARFPKHFCPLNRVVAVHNSQSRRLEGPLEISLWKFSQRLSLEILVARAGRSRRKRSVETRDRVRVRAREREQGRLVRHGCRSLALAYFLRFRRLSCRSQFRAAFDEVCVAQSRASEHFGLDNFLPTF